MRTFKGECAHFSFNKCPMYTHDGACAKFSANWPETDYSVERGTPKGKKTWGFASVCNTCILYLQRQLDKNGKNIFTWYYVQQRKSGTTCTVLFLIIIFKKDILVPSMCLIYYNFSIAKLCLNIIFLILKFPCSLWTLAWKNPQDSISGNWFSCYCFPIRGLGYGTSIFSIFTIS